MPRPLVDATPLSAADRALFGRVKAAVLTVEPGAEVILYGSRARGDAHAESDWDLLVLVDGNVDLARQGRVTEALLDLEL
ncbi:MAG: nucleotidyltransferase domain-containing protein [Bacteroidetes bacterium]|nr:nucleotidyltransferase domain-containing protein [Bacteroidota bacterium]